MTSENIEYVREFVERIERCESSRTEINEQISDIYIDAKSSGLNVPALREVVKRRRKDPATVDDLDAFVASYEYAMHSPSST